MAVLTQNKGYFESIRQFFHKIKILLFQLKMASNFFLIINVIFLIFFKVCIVIVRRLRNS